MISRLFSLAFLLLLAACGGGPFGRDDTDAEVREITIASQTISVGERRGIDINFRFSEDDVFRDGDDVVISVVLPAGIDFIDGSGEIDGVFDDKDVRATVVLCPNGSTILYFDLDDDDLRGADDPRGSSNARLEFDIVGASPIAGGNIEARADYNSTVVACDVTVVPQASLLITVVG